MMTSSAPNDDSGSEESHKQGQSNPPHPPSIAPHPTDYVMTQSYLDAGQSMVHTAYPYLDPYHGAAVSGYGGQAMMVPHLIGIHPAGAHPSGDAMEGLIYVNAKQYHGILRRRQSRAKAELENKLLKARKPYLHESRHLHATKRARGSGGRFLTSKGDEKNQEVESTMAKNAGSPPLVDDEPRESSKGKGS
ncbi:nuclear transcription factor Y subunit A-7-like isoform X2 [Wolffia australiana]